MTQKDSTNIQTYYVDGMHCAACENLLERTLQENKSVTKAKASLSKDQVEVEMQKGKSLNLANINKELEEYGYKLSKTPPSKTEHKTHIHQDALIAGFMLAMAAIVVIAVIERNNTLMAASLNSDSKLGAYFIFGILAGFSSCAALVGAILLTILNSWKEESKSKGLLPFSVFTLGRLLAFLILGFVLGLMGSIIKLSPTIYSILIISVSIFLIYLGAQMLGFIKRPPFKMPSFAVNFINKNEHKNKLVLIAVIGALTFFVPCGFTLIAQTTAFASGNATQSAISLFAFALGTLPALLLIAFASTALYSKKTLASLFTAFSGFLIIFMGIYSIYGQLKVFGLFTPAQIEKTSSGVEVVQPQNNQVPDIQYATITAKGFEYLPKTLTLKSDISTVLTIDNEGAYGCAQALYAKGLYPEIVYLKSGENQISFTPKKGTYQISCSMGMVPPVTVYVE